MAVIVRPEDLATLCRAALERVGVRPDAAASVADALVAAECMGIPSHGMSRLPQYADQAAAGKVRGDAVPRVETPFPAVVRVDAACGFAYPAIDAGLAVAVPLAKRMGCAVMGVTDSHHCGVGGLHVERAARQGLVALLFANTPAAMAPWGGNRASFGTNPVAFACPSVALPGRGEGTGAPGSPDGPAGADGPGADGPDPLVLDLSLSTVARGRIVDAARVGRPIPEGWAVAADGRPTTDPAVALGGMLLPFGGAKGAALALMVELLSASLTGSNHAFEATSFLDAEGGPPRTGQCMVLLSPQAFGADFAERAAALLGHVLDQPGTRLPGARRFELQRRALREGVPVPRPLHEELLRRAGKV